jgi:hypothetical protein
VNGFGDVGNRFLGVVDDFLGVGNRFGGVGKGFLEVGKDFLEVGNHVLAVGNRFLLPPSRPVPFPSFLSPPYRISFASALATIRQWTPLSRHSGQAKKIKKHLTDE